MILTKKETENILNQLSDVIDLLETFDDSNLFEGSRIKEGLSNSITDMKNLSYAVEDCEKIVEEEE